MHAQKLIASRGRLSPVGLEVRHHMLGVCIINPAQLHSPLCGLWIPFQLCSQARVPQFIFIKMITPFNVVLGPEPSTGLEASLSQLLQTMTPVAEQAQKGPQPAGPLAEQTPLEGFGLPWRC